MGRLELGIAAGIAAVVLGAETVMSRGAQPPIFFAPQDDLSEPASRIAKKYKSYFPSTSGGSGSEEAIQPEYRRYSGWLERRGDGCELWELHDAPQKGKAIVIFNSRPYHEEHQILQNSVSEHIIVNLKPWECAGNSILDVTTVELSPLDKRAYIPVTER